MDIPREVVKHMHRRAFAVSPAHENVDTCCAAGALCGTGLGKLSPQQRIARTDQNLAGP